MLTPIRHLALLLLVLASDAGAAPGKTNLTISGEDFHINGQPTYAGRSWNGQRIEGLLAMVKQTRAVPGYRPMPILFNEDDHENFDQPANNFAAALAARASWGWFDYRRKGEGFPEGYQSPPVNWGLSSDRKPAFFNKLAEVTGAKSP